MKRFIQAIAIFVGCVVLYFLAESFASRGKLPPSHVTDLAGYLAWRPDADQFVRLPGDRLLALGPGTGFFPSGPSATVFDSNGHLLAMTGDMGDDDAFRVRWGVSRSPEVIGRSAVPSRIAN